MGKNHKVWWRSCTWDGKRGGEGEGGWAEEGVEGGAGAQVLIARVMGLEG